MQGRLIPLESCVGAWNMSVDQALLESVDETQVPVLRLYQWSQPTLSLGYFQKLADRSQHLASTNAACVRRSTGGGAIMHDHELTYSIAVPIKPSHSGARTDLYQGMHQIIRAALANWSVTANPYREDPRHRGNEDSLLCFQRRTDEDLIVSGYKVLGSAQRKSRKAILQHGSLLLRGSRFAPELPGVEDLGANAISVSDLASLIARQSAKRWEIQFHDDCLSDDEKRRSSQINESRFSSAAWQTRR